MALSPTEEVEQAKIALQNAIIKKNYNEICDLLQLSQEQRLSEQGGEIGCATIKQFITESGLARGALIAVGVSRISQPVTTPKQEET